MVAVSTFWRFLLAAAALIGTANCQCGSTVTTCSGTKAPQQVCAGALIFEDNFNSFDLSKWQHEVSFSGGRNYEFQWYLNNRSNSYTQDGILYITPTLTGDVIGGQGALEYAYLNIYGASPPEECTGGRNVQILPLFLSLFPFISIILLQSLIFSLFHSFLFLSSFSFLIPVSLSLP